MRLKAYRDEKKKDGANAVMRFVLFFFEGNTLGGLGVHTNRTCAGVGTTMTATAFLLVCFGAVHREERGKEAKSQREGRVVEKKNQALRARAQKERERHTQFPEEGESWRGVKD